MYIYICIQTYNRIVVYSLAAEGHLACTRVYIWIAIPRIKRLPWIAIPRIKRLPWIAIPRIKRLPWIAILRMKRLPY